MLIPIAYDLLTGAQRGGVPPAFHTVKNLSLDRGATHFTLG